MDLNTQMSVFLYVATAMAVVVLVKYAMDIAKFVKDNRKTPMGDSEWMVTLTIEAACLLAEKMFASGEGQKKLAFVLNYVKTEAERFGIKVDMVEVTNLINKFVDEVINKDRKENV